MKVTLRRQPDDTYVSSDGRWRVTPDHDREAVTRGKGPRIWWLADLTGRELPGTHRTLATIRERINR